jgi:hypothetical protein
LRASRACIILQQFTLIINSQRKALAMRLLRLSFLFSKT